MTILLETLVGFLSILVLILVLSIFENKKMLGGMGFVVTVLVVSYGIGHIGHLIYTFLGK